MFRNAIYLWEFMILICLSVFTPGLSFMANNNRDGQWSKFHWEPWTSWSICDGECNKNGDQGHQYRERECLGEHNEPVAISKCHPSDKKRDVELMQSNDGNHKDAKRDTMIESQSQRCYATCNVWSDWSLFSSCSVTCGNGTSSRTRYCTFGNDCIGESTQHSSCQQPDCVVDGQWGTWSSFVPCFATCGTSLKYRSRECDSPAPAGGGFDCVGNQLEYIKCNVQECPVDGQWGTWSNFDQCSASCGHGVQFRSRQCDSPAPTDGGLDCVGKQNDFQSCTLRACVIDGGWSNFTEVGCSTTCGDGVMSSVRTCTNPAPSNGGQNCSGPYFNYTPCHNAPCPVSQWGAWSDWSKCSTTEGTGVKLRTRNCTSPANDCVGKDDEIVICTVAVTVAQWSTWTSWGACDVTCGDGTKHRSRVCQSGSGQCMGQTTETVSCNNGACIVGNAYSDWSSWSVCSATCGYGVSTRKRACLDPNGHGCTDGYVQIHNCKLTECVIDGGWSDWSVFSQCGSLCGYGYMSRTRTCTNPKPEHGGQNCTGHDEDRVICNSGACPSDVPTCDKAQITSMVASNPQPLTTQPPCNHTADVILQSGWLQHVCNAPADTTVWNTTDDVRQTCDSLTLYSPMMRRHLTTNAIEYGTIVDCHHGKLTYASVTCDKGIHELSIDLQQDTTWEYNILKW